MSVEQPVDEAANVTMQAKISDCKDARLQGVVNEGIDALDDSHTEDGGNFDSKQPNISHPGEARVWFNALSETERSANIGFVDKIFLETIRQAMFSPSLNIENLPPKSGVNWNKKIRIQHLDQLYYSLSLSSASNTTARNTETSFGNDESASQLTCEMIEVANATTYSEETRETDDSIETTLFDNCWAVFPSTLSLLTKDVMDGDCPFVTITSPGDTGIDDHFLSVFDSLSNKYFGASFLQNISHTSENKKAWLRRLEKCYPEERIPLFVAMLARFESEACQSYHQYTIGQSRPTMNGTKVSRDGEIASEESLRNSQLGISIRRPLDTLFLAPVFSYGQLINDQIHKIDAITRNKILEPIAKAFRIEDTNFSNFPLRNLTTAPLQLVFASMQGCDLNYCFMDEAIKQALQLLQYHASKNDDLSCLVTGLDHRYSKILTPQVDTADQTLKTTVENDELIVATVTATASDSEQVQNETKDAQRTQQTKAQKKKKKKGKKKKTRKAGTSATKGSPPQLKDDSNGENEELDADSVATNEAADEVVKDEKDQLGETVENNVLSTKSCDSADSVLSDKVSVKSTNTSRNSTLEADRPDSITISRYDGRIIVSSPTGGKSKEAVEVTSGERLPSEATAVADDEDAWETVEVRSKANKKKVTEKSTFNNVKGHHQSNSNLISTTDSNNKKQKGSRLPNSRKKNNSRKIVREILLSVIDSVDEESKKRKATSVPSSIPQLKSPPPTIVTPTARPAGNPWKNGPPGKATTTVVYSITPPKPLDVPAKPKTLRDVVLGTHKAPVVPAPTKTAVSPENRLPPVDETISRPVEKKEISSPAKSVQTVRGKGNAGDQNTAPTYQETISAVSANSNPVFDSKDNARNEAERVVKSDSSSGDTDEAPQNKDRQAISNPDKEVALTPPLPTLLSPENANSSTSSVASSLEAPHVAYTPHHSKSAPRPNDVGYHLLDVCDRLSRDMNLFMSRRAIALNPRRRERGALLAALQESVSSLWPKGCHVELYGSCAIQLDLPSSDLDVVVVGLDRAENEAANVANEDKSRQTGRQSSHRLNPPPPPPQYVRMLNGERVIRLAKELESQFWAVQVKAIPTASVPVVKILADPSRLAGSSPAEEYTSQGTDSEIAILSSETSVPNEHSPSVFIPQATYLQWRGLDVMKGLLALDITFEGFGHGGIGSTIFSSRIVEEACRESGLQPDSTPFVQVLMVLKELLAQRNLNEPYSGGLSSYALLLLLLALVREREVIKEEIELVEKQRRAMTSADCQSFALPTPNIPSNDQTHSSRAPEIPILSDNESKQISVGKSVSKSTPAKPKSSDSKTNDQVNSKQLSTEPDSQVKVPTASTTNKPTNSWATVAKKASVNGALPNVVNNTPQPPHQAQKITKPTTKPSFADAVASPPSVKATSAQSTPVNSNKKKIVDNKVIDNKVELKESNTKSITVEPSTNAASTHGAQSNMSDSTTTVTIQQQAKGEIFTSAISDPPLIPVPAHYTQGVNDIIEVLCTGETTAGKLLMHFLLFYGQYFDAHTTAIDISGKHPRDSIQYSQTMSPFIIRSTPGRIDPYTGMLIVDPIVVFDPLEGAEQNNVARRCFAWNSVRQLFVQSYETLSSAVERSATPPLTPNGKLPVHGPGGSTPENRSYNESTASINQEMTTEIWDTKSPLLSCLLSF